MAREICKCSKWDMAIHVPCAICDVSFANDTIKMDNGTEVHVSECPNGGGTVKSIPCWEGMHVPSYGMLIPRLAIKKRRYQADTW